MEEDDGFVERAEHQSNRERKHAKRRADKREASLSAGHLLVITRAL